MRLYLLVAALFMSMTMAAPAYSAPALPLFGSSIDDYAEYDAQDTCDPGPKPGVLAFKDLLQQEYGPHMWGVSRSCKTPGVSEHEEGRALDYHFDYYQDDQRADADDLLTWLLASDRHGNPHAIARRLGLMYIIWNRQIWESYRPSQGWQSYDGSNPHTDHIHFSFSWPGALASTSWWTGAIIPTTPPGSQLGDFDGDGRPDVATFGEQLAIARNVSEVGVPAKTPAQVIEGDWSHVRQPVITDWDGDGRKDVLGRQGDSTMVWLSTSSADAFSFAPAVDLGAIARYLAPADFDGDGRPDLATLTADGDTLSIALNASTPGAPSIMEERQAASGWAPIRQLMTVDWDGDGKADILGRDGESLLVWLGTGSGFASYVKLGSVGTSRILTPADHDGDGKPDLAVLSEDANILYFSRNTSTPGWPSTASGEEVPGGYATQQQLMTADFDADGRADVVGRHGAVLQVWLSSSTATTWSFQSYVALTRKPGSARNDPYGERPEHRCGQPTLHSAQSGPIGEPRPDPAGGEHDEAVERHCDDDLHGAEDHSLQRDVSPGGIDELG